jgi:hypothetical protein
MEDVLTHQTFANTKEQNKSNKKSNINSKYCEKYQDMKQYLPGKLYTTLNENPVTKFLFC